MPNQNTKKIINYTSVVLLFMAFVTIGVILRDNQRKQPPPPPTVIEKNEEAFVSITEDGVIPKSIKIKTDTKVIWTNQDTESHQLVTSLPNDKIKDFGSPVLAEGDSYSYTFTNPGTFAYHEKSEPSDSDYKGTVIVE